eukprot:Gb_01109 [translate_table: standard]
MGNAKANAYWEAELPPNFKRPTENDRVGLENFVRAKITLLGCMMNVFNVNSVQHQSMYEAKRWVPRNSRSPLRTREEKSFPADKQKAITDIKDHRDHDTSEKLGNNVGEETRALHGGKETEHYDTRNAKDRERSRGTHGRSDQAESSRSSRSPVRHQSTSSTSITMPSEPPGKSHQMYTVTIFRLYLCCVYCEYLRLFVVFFGLVSRVTCLGNLDLFSIQGTVNCGTALCVAAILPQY